MPATARVPLGAATLNRKWWLDINSGTYGAPTWLPVDGISDFKASRENTLQDDSDFDSEGAKSSAATAYGWSVECKLQRKVTVASAVVYDPGQEAIRAAANGLGLSNVVDIRWYEMTSGGPTVEAWRGYAVASFAEDGGAMDALDTVSVVLTGKGARTPITHPEGAPSAVPTISLLNPYTDVAAGGEMVMISGTGFIGTVATTGVKFGATNADDWVVLSDNVIVAIAPAHAAGSVNVTVTNATGVSISVATFIYTT